MLEFADVNKQTDLTASFESLQNLLKQIDVDYSLDLSE